ncbi:nuclear autoantigenic sperm protein isoform X2 [Syngnathus scovelli]|uniref:nuclear autoantigenic sperm protein isoform X2 n=1 Tax=Syngnathus scovelli TaxID=161590 RepID=UPI0021108F63|nr:nuclear autoantigenic sperm protein isoform X2 [Syngnathus scovelli]
MSEEMSVASSSGSGVDEQPCSSSAPATDSSSGDVMEEAKKLIGTGNRHLVMGDIVAAVRVFQDACSMLAARYGDTADECGEAFFLCGKSLLELARLESTVLGNALVGVPEESDDDDDEKEEQPTNSNIESANNLDENTRDELRKQVYDAMAAEPEAARCLVESGTEVKRENGLAESPTEQAGAHSGEPVDFQLNGGAKSAAEEAQVNGVANGAGGAAESPEKEAKTEDSDEQAEAEESSKPEEEAEDEDDDDDDDDDGEVDKNGDKEEEDDVDNLQLAWEMLEVAKVIFKRKESKEQQLMAAQTLLKLGEVGAEAGNYPQALEDFQECLALQLKHLPPHSRLLAETHYHVAAMHCYMDQYGQAIQHYNSSVKVIETRLAMLQNLIDAAESTEEATTEMEELKQLLPDIREKIEDAEEIQKTDSAASQAVQQTLGGASTSSASRSENGSSSAFAGPTQIPMKATDGASSSKVASDISHLVRKKPAVQSSA